MWQYCGYGQQTQLHIQNYSKCCYTSLHCQSKNGKIHLYFMKELSGIGRRLLVEHAYWTEWSVCRTLFSVHTHLENIYNFCLACADQLFNTLKTGCKFIFQISSAIDFTSFSHLLHFAIDFQIDQFCYFTVLTLFRITR